MRGIIYARVSTDEQAKPGLASIPHQIELCQKLAQTDNIEITEVFTDDKSGQTLDRPGLQSILFQKDGYTHLYVYDTTRLGRNRKVLSTIRDELQSAGIKLRLVHGDTSEMDEESRVYMQSILDASAEAEIIRLRRRARMGRERRSERGLMAGKVPLGWLAVRNEKGQALEYKHDPAFDRFFQDLESLLLSGAPFASFPKEMLARGHKSPYTGKMWSVTALKHILRNPVNMGDLVFGWTSRPKKEQIVSRGVFPPRWVNPSAVAKELHRRNGLKGAARKQKYRLTGILICGYCGWKMTSQIKSYMTKKFGERRWVRYRCTKHTEYQSGRWPEDCQANYIMEKEALNQIATWLKSLADPASLDQYILGLAGTNTKMYGINELDQRITEIDQIMVGLVDRIAILPAGAMRDVRSRMEELAAERTLLEEQGHEIRQEAQRAIALDDYKQTLIEAAEGLPELLVKAPAHLVQAKLKFLFPDGIRVRDGTIIT